jgi:uncharacterized C2H2 Zn-finger protein
MAMDLGPISVRLEDVEGLKLLHCPDCDNTIATDGTYIRIEHHDSGAHTVYPADDDDA